MLECNACSLLANLLRAMNENNTTRAAQYIGLSSPCCDTYERMIWWSGPPTFLTAYTSSAGNHEAKTKRFENWLLTWLFYFDKTEKNCKNLLEGIDDGSLEEINKLTFDGLPLPCNKTPPRIKRSVSLLQGSILYPVVCWALAKFW